MATANGLGFFAWLREGVRRAVLMGFSDAIAEVGNRNADEDLSPHLADHLQQSLIVEQSGERTPLLAASGTAPGARKRLGKGLDQLQTAAKPA
ncbi:MAG: hypothetical protein QM811_00365 [Pirellulales bacterium]